MGLTRNSDLTPSRLLISCQSSMLNPFSSPPSSNTNGRTARVATRTVAIGVCGEAGPARSRRNNAPARRPMVRRLWGSMVVITVFISIVTSAIHGNAPASLRKSGHPLAS